MKRITCHHADRVLEKPMLFVSRSLSICVMILLAMVTGCGHHPIAVPTAIPDAPDGDRSILAGEWQYEEGAVVTLRLDEQGHGSYAWKGGRFETTRLGDHTWVGKWYQEENDREGGFLVKLSPDYTEGEGTWWYVRIGGDRVPAQKGGTFHLTKKTTMTNLSETPPAP